MTRCPMSLLSQYPDTMDHMDTMSHTTVPDHYLMSRRQSTPVVYLTESLNKLALSE